LSVAFWAWICVTVLLALAEAASGGLLMLPWAVGAGAAALLEALHVESTWQWIAFVVVSLTLFTIAQRFIRRRK
jgi:membrane protein implicated in regulation of membrane protease activity